jgi:hypothetical protein
MIIFEGIKFLKNRRFLVLSKEDKSKSIDVPIDEVTADLIVKYLNLLQVEATNFVEVLNDEESD